ncbi:MAG: phosphoenolpyruvate hydrolase family protein, partial [Mesorhizobium sp.]
RLPAEAAIAKQTADFKAVAIGRGKATIKKKKG